MTVLRNGKTLFVEALCLTSYFEEEKGFLKPLEKNAEEKYFLRIAEGDKEALNKLVAHNMRLVVHIAKRYIASVESDELISIGSIGLVKAIRSFNYDRGTQFSTYAAKCIENEILMHIRANKKHSQNISYNSPIGSDKEGNEITLMETLCDESYEVAKDLERENLSLELKDIINKQLTPREKAIICVRFGLFGYERMPQRILAEKLGISRSYISRIEKKALFKLRKYMIENNMDASSWI